MTVTGTVRLDISDQVASVVFDRPQARNAMTFAMYDELDSALTRIADDGSLIAAVFRGAGSAFVSGTDIGEFRGFSSADDGVRYEARVERTIAALEALPIPTFAVIEGVATGGGLILACACDFRLVGPAARLGVPIARTVGNSLSRRNAQRLAAAFGRTAAARMLILSELFGPEEAVTCGFALPPTPGDALLETLDNLLLRLRGLAPLTVRASKHMLRYELAEESEEDTKWLKTVYGSQDFTEGVGSFLSKRSATWAGR